MLSVFLMGCSENKVELLEAGAEVPLGDCDDYNLLRNPYFGDLHVHTSYSFDAITHGTNNDPQDAYAFAKGTPLNLPVTEMFSPDTQVIQLERPLDFAAVTDHAEGLAPVDICHNLTSIQYFSPYCLAYRASDWGNSLIDSISFVLGGYPLALPGGVIDHMVCIVSPKRCELAVLNMWNKIQNAAELAYDRSTDCSFSTFIGYEYTGVPLLNNQHRNVIFKNDVVVSRPIDYMDADTDHELWNLLDAGCTDLENGCEVLTTPHNSNLSGGTMYVASVADQPYTEEVALQRQRLEPLMEIYQTKGDSECLNSLLDPLGSQDELCDSDKMVRLCENGETTEDCVPLCSDLPFSYGGFSGSCVEPGDFARGVLKKGLLEEIRMGANPFKTGFIASTDTHNASPGNVNEKLYFGHHGNKDGDFVARVGKGLLQSGTEGALGEVVGSIFGGVDAIKRNPGGLAVVWAEQNSRSVLFEAMKSREAYGTSGTRIIARFFGGWNYDAEMCDAADFVAQGYSSGVPMGSDLPSDSRGRSNIRCICPDGWRDSRITWFSTATNTNYQRLGREW